MSKTFQMSTRLGVISRFMRKFHPCHLQVLLNLLKGARTEKYTKVLPDEKQHCRLDNDRGCWAKPATVLPDVEGGRMGP